jgi:putative transposase
MLEENHITESMSKSASPYDNAPVESFFSPAKMECIYRKEYVTIDEVRMEPLGYIELF